MRSRTSNPRSSLAIDFCYPANPGSPIVRVHGVSDEEKHVTVGSVVVVSAMPAPSWEPSPPHDPWSR